jgi:hypothetical protein
MKKFIKNPRILFPFFMALFMAFIMSGALTLLNIGLVDDFIFKWLKSFLFGFMIAFPTAFFIAPLVHKIVNKIVNKN